MKAGPLRDRGGGLEEGNIGRVLVEGVNYRARRLRYRRLGLGRCEKTVELSLRLDEKLSVFGVCRGYGFKQGYFHSVIMSLQPVSRCLGALLSQAA